MVSVGAVSVVCIFMSFTFTGLALCTIRIQEYQAGGFYLSVMDGVLTLVLTGVLATLVESLSYLMVAYLVRRQEHRNSLENAMISYYTKSEKAMEESAERMKRMDVSREAIATRMLELLKLEIDRRSGGLDTLDSKTESVAGSQASVKEETFCPAKNGNAHPPSDTTSEISNADTKR